MGNPFGVGKEEATSCKPPAASWDYARARNVYRLTIFFLAALFFFNLKSLAQIPVGEFDTTRTATPDTLTTYNGKKVITIESYSKRFDPRKAILYAAVLPGAGQAYNNKYWKLPLVYGGFTVGVLVIGSYQRQYVAYKSELFSILNTGSKLSPKGYTEEQLRSVINTARRQRDFFCALTGLWYVLQMVDAHVDAHLKEFDLNPRLQVRVEPSMENHALTGRSTGLSLKLRF